MLTAKIWPLVRCGQIFINQTDHDNLQQNFDPLIFLDMPILYSSVARDSTVLADHADVVGNFEAATQQILDRTDSSKFSRHTYSVNQ